MMGNRQLEFNSIWIPQRADPYVYRHTDGTYYFTASVPEYDRIVLVVNIYQAVQRRQHFGMIQNAFIRIVDARTNQELCKYNLNENYTNMTAMIFGEVYRYNGEWKFNAIGQATTDPGLGELVGRYV